MTEQTNTTRETKMIAVSDLKVTAVNMRHTGKKPDVSDIIESVRQKGVIQSLLVRPNCDGYEVVAGERRYYAAVEAEVGSVPCVVMKEGDDAEALELSLLENLHRLDPDALTQFETFAKLKDKGRTVEDIAATFGIPVSSVKKRLALANVNPRIRALYRKDQVSDGELQTFTLATPAQQKAWLKLYREKGAYAPRHG